MRPQFIPFVSLYLLSVLALNINIDASRSRWTEKINFIIIIIIIIISHVFVVLQKVLWNILRHPRMWKWKYLIFILIQRFEMHGAGRVNLLIVT